MSGSNLAGGSSKPKVESSKPPETWFKRKRGMLQKDLQHMMYGYGDDVNVHMAQDVASKRGKLLTEDFLYLIRKDMPKLNRCTKLLTMNEELKQARKAFEVDEEKLTTAD